MKLNAQSYIAIVAVFWLLVLSVVCGALAHGTNKSKQQYQRVAALLIALAWISVAGVPIYEWVKAWMFG